MNTAQQLHQAGQSIWYDNIQQVLLENGDAADALAGLESLGVSKSQVTDELEQEGVKSFADASTELLAAVEARRQGVTLVDGAVPSAGVVAA